MSLLLTLAVGVALIIGACLLLLRLTTLSANQAAMITALAALGLYLPIAVLDWPGTDVVAIHVAVYMMSCVGFAMIKQTDANLARTPAQRQRKRLHWAPASIVGFFVVLFVVDAIFVIMAEHGLPAQLTAMLLPGTRGTDNVSSAFPGVVSHDFQKYKTLYNDYLLQRQRQRERGWQIRKGWLGKPLVNEPAVFQVVATTRDGAPLTRAQIKGRFLRPSDSRLDTAFVMQEIEPGTYQASLRLPAAGEWDLVMRLRKGEDLHEIRASTSVLTP